MVTALNIPLLPDATRSHFVKLGARKYMVISIAMVAVILWLDDDGAIEGMRIAVGSCSSAPTRLIDLEDALIGYKQADIETETALWSRYLTPLHPIDDVRGSANYRLEAAAELSKRAVLGALTKGATNG